MRIRNEQLQAMAEAQDIEYHFRLKKFFRETLPTETRDLNDDVLLRIIEEGVRKAKIYGMITGEAIAKFVGLRILIKADFDEEPAVRRYLNSPDLDADFKMNMLSELLSIELRSLLN